MAGDWMKIELELPDKPEVHSIAAALNLDPDCVVGKLIRVWQWFDKHTTDGNAFGVTYSLLDRISGVTGFGEAMMFCGWMEQNDKNLTMPKFDRHTSASAKQRALTAKRVEKIRNKNVTDTALPREEKRREDNKEKTSARSDKSLHAVSFDFITGKFSNLNGQVEIWRNAYPAVSIDLELNKAAAWLVANPKNRKSNYSRFLSNWLSRVQDKAPSVQPKKQPWE